jgi:hypothetical protein
MEKQRKICNGTRGSGRKRRRRRKSICGRMGVIIIAIIEYSVIPVIYVVIVFIIVIFDVFAGEKKAFLLWSRFFWDEKRCNAGVRRR